MKLLAIMGSPHRGASHALTERIEQHLVRHDDVEFEYLNLKDMNLEPCRGCFLCFLKGEDRCPIRDDRAMIDQKMTEADGVIFVSPVYSMHVTSLMKRFIDRFAYTFHRPRYFGRYSLLLSTTGGMGLKEVFKYMKGTAFCWGFENVGELGEFAPPHPLPLLKKQKDKTEITAERFYRAVKRNRRRKLGIMDHIMFFAMRALYGSLEKKDPVPYDHLYWKERGMFDRGRKYFVDGVRHSIPGVLIGRFVGWIMKLKLR